MATKINTPFRGYIPEYREIFRHNNPVEVCSPMHKRKKHCTFLYNAFHSGKIYLLHFFTCYTSEAAYTQQNQTKEFYIGQLGFQPFGSQNPSSAHGVGEAMLAALQAAAR
ncbi:hypothetical protein [Chitinophaga eiseniae]|nr:hypothetical protein [Chitinophaga eiseniae]